MRRLLNTLYVTNPEAYLRKKDDSISVTIEGSEVMKMPFHLLDGIVLFGHAGCSMPLLGACSSHGITVSILDELGRFAARVEGPVSGNVLLRRDQFANASDAFRCLHVAKRFVAAKIHNSRIVLQHFARDYPELKALGVEEAVGKLRGSLASVATAPSLEQLRGVEGDAAHAYYQVFGLLLRTRDEGLRFESRSRRPPADPVNSALSFFYVPMSRDLVSACETVGLDPQMGYLHACRPGRASLALDLLEEFRAPYVDRFVLSLFNRRQLARSDFAFEGNGVRFKDAAMKKALSLWQEKKQEQINHPYLGEKVQLGLLPHVQAQLLARYLRGDLDDYPALLWR